MLICERLRLEGIVSKLNLLAKIVDARHVDQRVQRSQMGVCGREGGPHCALGVSRGVKSEDVEHLLFRTLEWDGGRGGVVMR